MLKPSFLSNEYMVSDEGYILSKKGYPLKPSKNKRGYCIVNLMINGKRKGVAVHTLVARAFCSGYKEGYTVNHKDGNKSNNHYTNLEWVTPLENTLHAIYVLGKNNKGSNNPNARCINAYYKETGILYKTFTSIIEAAKDFAQNDDYEKIRHIENCIVRAAKGRRKTYKNYIWEYA